MPDHHAPVENRAGRASQTPTDELYRRAAEARHAAETTELAHVRAAQLRAAARWTELAQLRERQAKGGQAADAAGLLACAEARENA